MFAQNWMPLFGDEFWESERVAAMEDSAVLLYQWLIWRQWKHGDLPGPDVLRRLPHRWGADWDRLWPQVESCFDVLKSGRLSNPRCAKELQIASEISARAREKGLLSGKARRGSGSNRNTNPVRTESRSGSNRTSAPVEPGPDSTEQDNTPTVCVAHARTREDAPQLEHAGVNGHLSTHPTLDTPDVRAALERWGRHLAERNKFPTSVSWESNLARWERWGPAKLARNITATIDANLCTVIDAQHGGDPGPAPSVAREPEPIDAEDVRERWDRKHRRGRQIPNPTGMPGLVTVYDPFPGYAAAKRELDGAVTP